MHRVAPGIELSDGPRRGQAGPAQPATPHPKSCPDRPEQLVVRQPRRQRRQHQYLNLQTAGTRRPEMGRVGPARFCALRRPAPWMSTIDWLREDCLTCSCELTRSSPTRPSSTSLRCRAEGGPSVESPVRPPPPESDPGVAGPRARDRRGADGKDGAGQPDVGARPGPARQRARDGRTVPKRSVRSPARGGAGRLAEKVTLLTRRFRAVPRARTRASRSARCRRAALRRYFRNDLGHPNARSQ